jgi:hypothetical protein
MFIFMFRGCIPFLRGLEDAPGVRPYWVNGSLVDGNVDGLANIPQLEYNNF